MTDPLYYHVPSWFGRWKVVFRNEYTGNEIWIATFSDEVFARRFTNHMNGFKDLDDDCN
jgi:hypothetical protein